MIVDGRTLAFEMATKSSKKNGLVFAKNSPTMAYKCGWKWIDPLSSEVLHFRCLRIILSFDIVMSIGNSVFCGAVATAGKRYQSNRLCRTPRETYLRLRGGSPDRNTSMINRIGDADSEAEKKTGLDKLKDLIKSLSRSPNEGNNTEIGPGKQSSAPSSDEDEDELEEQQQLDESQARLLAIRRLILAQEEARRRRAQNPEGQTQMVTLIVPPRQTSGIAGFISYMLAHPLLFFMCIDAILGLATRKSVPEEVIHEVY
jgi:hypothetical protein